jgi:propionyl-CoA carboxylase alpha chain
MAQALDNYVIRGVTNNISLLRDIITEENFVNGETTTKYLQKIYPDGFKGKQLNQKETHNIVSVVAALFVKNQLRNNEFLNVDRYFNFSS